MAVSGLVMVLFLLVHMYGNLKVFSGRPGFDDYAHHLRTVGEPFLPYAGALWMVRVVLAVSVVIHIGAALIDQHDAEGFGGCTQIGECTALFPKGIQLDVISRYHHDVLGALLHRED